MPDTDDIKTEGNRLTNMAFDEVSLVTRGANQGAQVVLFKSDIDPDIIEKTCDHASLKNGETCDSCGGKKGSKRAKVKKNKNDVDDTIHDDPEAAGTLSKNTGNDQQETDMPQTQDTELEAPDLTGVPDEVQAFIAKLAEKNAELTKDNEELAELLDEEVEEGDEEEDFNEEDEEDDEDEVGKLDPEVIAKLDPAIQAIVKSHEAALDRAARAETIAKAERAIREKAELGEIVKGMTTDIGTDNAKLTEALYAVSKACDPEVYETIEAAITSANEVAKSGGLKEKGTDRGRDVVSKAASVVDERIAALKKSDPDLSDADALVKVFQADGDLYAQYVNETHR